MVSHTGQHIITINMLSNISKSKGKQIMKFRQLIEYNIRNIILQKNTQNVVEKPDPFIKNQN